MTNTPIPDNEETLPASPATVDYSLGKPPRPRFGRGPLIAGIVGGVLALGMVFGSGILVGHFVVPSDATVTQSHRGFAGTPGQNGQNGQNGQRPHFPGNPGGMTPGQTPGEKGGMEPGNDFDPGAGIQSTAAPAT
jgi:hypothetical protein